MPIALNGSGTVTGISTGGISDTKAVADAAMPAGAILQVVSATKTDRSSFASTSFADIPGLSASITPTSSSNKIFIMANIYTSKGSNVDRLNFVRDSTNIAQPDGSPTHPATMMGYTSNVLNMRQRSMSFLDTPGDTNAHTYKVQICGSNTGTIWVNRYNSSDDYYGISTLTLMEVVG